MTFDSANSHLIEEAEDGHKKAAGAASCNEDRNLAKGKHARARFWGHRQGERYGVSGAG